LHHQSDQRGFVFTLSCQEEVEAAFLLIRQQGMLLKKQLCGCAWICWGYPLLVPLLLSSASSHLLWDWPLSRCVLWIVWCFDGLCGVFCVGSNFRCMVMNVGITPKITPKLLIWNMMLELVIVYGKVNNGHGNATTIRHRITRAFEWHLRILMEINTWNVGIRKRAKITP
jgi:hypothetical protein